MFKPVGNSYGNGDGYGDGYGYGDGFGTVGNLSMLNKKEKNGSNL